MNEYIKTLQFLFKLIYGVKLLYFFSKNNLAKNLPHYCDPEFDSLKY